MVVESYLIAIVFDIYQMWTKGILVRYGGLPIVRFAAGVHDYAILMALIAGVLGFAYFRGSLIRGLAFPIIAYSVHETLFNVFFLSYNFSVPGLGYLLWWIEMGVLVAVSLTAIGLRMFQLRRAAIGSLLALTALTLLWMSLGFPVSTNIFQTASQNAVNNTNILANGFEIAWNLLSLSFIGLAYKWR